MYLEKTCKKCGGQLWRRPKGGVVCKPCVAERAGVFYHKHKERLRPGRMAYKEANRAKLSAKESARYWAMSPEERRALGDKHTADFREWCRLNPEEARAKRRKWAKTPATKAAQRKHKALRRGRAGGSFTREEFEDILESQDYACFDCGSDMPNGKYTVGHLHPLSKGGSNFPSNLVAQCLSCNCSQHDKIHPAAGRIHEYRNVALRDCEEIAA